MATDQDQDQVLRLGKADEGRYVSSEEFATAVFDEPWRYERIDERLFIVAPAGGGHVGVSEPWRDRLGAYRLQHPDIVDMVVSEAWIRVDGGTDRVGDIGVYLKSQDSPPSIPDRVPEMMFEVVSPGRMSRERDYARTRADYHRFGVREYVVIDRRRRTVTVFRWEPDRYDETVLSADDTYTSPLLPGLTIPLADVLGPA